MIAAVLAFAAANQIAVLGALALMVVLVILLMALVLVRGGRRHVAVAAHDDEKADLELAALPAAEHHEAERKVKAAVESKSLRGLLRAGLAGYREAYARDPYLMPWVLRIGGIDDGGILAALEDVHPPVGDAERDGLGWYYYLHGMILNVTTASAFGEILRFVSQRRPSLPLDGIILTIPIEKLAEVRTASAAGTQIYDQLWAIQRQLGFAVPIYVVITGTEVLQGFSAFEKMLPEGLRSGMIGWSSPYALESAFTTEYVGEALQSVDQAMLSAAMEAFGHVVDARAGTQLVRVREDLAAMEEPLRNLLGIAFRRTAYQESLYFRGLYFVLRPEPEEPASLARDLIEHKVFAERGLSRPLRGAAQSRQIRRWLWPAVAGVAALAAVASIALSLSHLSQYREVVEPILRATATDLTAVASRQDTAPDTASADADATVRFLRNVSALDQSQPLVMIPLSWFGGDPYGVQAAMRAGWHGIALRSLKLLIEQHLKALPAAGDGNGSSADNLASFLGKLTDADAAMSDFNDLARGGKQVQLGPLLQYTLGIPVSRTALARLQSWGAIGPGSTPVSDPTLAVDPGSFQGPDLAAFHDLADSYFHELALGGEATARLGAVSRELAELARGGQRAAAAVAGFTEAWSGLQDATRSLASSGASWIGASRPDIPADINAMITQAAASPLLGPEGRSTADSLAQSRYDEVKGQIAAFASVIGPLVTRAANGTVTLSAAADGLRTTLGQWLNSSFMQKPAAGNAATPASGYGWDQTALEAVPPLFEDYLIFQAKNLPQVPTALRAPVNATAQYQLQTNIQAALDLASAPVDANSVAQTASVNDLRQWSAALRTAFPVLEQTIQTFMQLGMNVPADALRNRVASLASAIVQRVDRIVDEDQLYLPDRSYLGNWRGGPLSPAGLFGQADAAGLNQYLTSSRLEVSTLAREVASPMLEVLARPVMQNTTAYAVAAKWLAVVSALDQYDASRPNNSLMTLEKFITDGIPAINDQNCLQTQAGFAMGGDFFLQRLGALKDAVRQRCIAMVDEQLVAGYQQIQSQFNTQLAGRAPFAPVSARSTNSPASAANIRDFYALVDAHADDVVKRLASIADQRPEWRDAARFIAAMNAARPLITQIADPAPGTSITIVSDFRVDRDHETGGADIVEWQLHSADRVQSSFMPKAGLAWNPGDRLALSLRWAKDGPVVPMAVGASPAIDGLTATFQREGQWALLDFLRAYRAAASSNGRVVDAFEIHTQPRPDAAGAPAPLSALARIYVGLEVDRTTIANGQRKDELLPFTTLPAIAPAPPHPALPLLSVQPQVEGSLEPTSVDRAVFGLSASTLAADSDMPAPMGLKPYRSRKGGAADAR